MVAQDGLLWVEKTFGLEPQWTRDPDISKVEAIARKHFKLDPMRLAPLNSTPKVPLTNYTRSRP